MLLERGLDCTLDGQPRLAPRELVADAAQAIIAAWESRFRGITTG
jgi:hypothetical protein